MRHVQHNESVSSCVVKDKTAKLDTTLERDAQGDRESDAISSTTLRPPPVLLPVPNVIVTKAAPANSSPAAQDQASILETSGRNGMVSS